jgi:hypothetical protein
MPLFAAKPAPVCHVGSVAYPTIQSAVDDADCDAVNVPAGTYYENVTIAGRTVVIRGAGPNATFVHGGGVGRVFQIWGSEVTLKGLTITGGETQGHTSDCSDTYWTGAGVTGTSSLVTVKDCVVRDNVALGRNGCIARGGGLNMYLGTLVVKDTVVRDNVADRGAGIRGAGEVTRVMVMDSVVRDNDATDVGGGLQINNGKLTIRDTMVTGNSAGNTGGGIYNFSGTLESRDSIVAGNTPNDIQYVP